MKIPKFRLEFERSYIKQMQRGIKDILASGRTLSNGKYCREFENSFRYSFYGNYRYALAVGSGTDALELALRGCDALNKTIIISDNTMVAQPLVIDKIGSQIKKIDIELETLSMQYCKLDHVINQSKKEIGAVILTHIGGFVSKNITQIAKLCKKNNIPLIEDAAHAIGAKAGYGDIICHSFYPTKVMTTGEGGMVITNNEEYYKKMSKLRQFGWDEHNVSTINGGGNMKMTEMQAYMGLLELRRVKSRIKRRREINDIYCKHLFRVYSQDGCPYYKTIILLEEREKIIRYCAEKGIEMTGFVYDPPVHLQPIYKKKGEEKYFPYSTYFSKHHICPPCYPELKDEEIEYICQTIGEVI